MTVSRHHTNPHLLATTFNSPPPPPTLELVQSDSTTVVQRSASVLRLETLTRKISHKSIRQIFGVLIRYLCVVCFTGKKEHLAA